MIDLALYKRCPCCGGYRRPLAVSGNEYIDGEAYHRVACVDCGASTVPIKGDCGLSFYIGTLQASIRSRTDIEAWNRGPIVPRAVVA